MLLDDNSIIDEGSANFLQPVQIIQNMLQARISIRNKMQMIF